MLRHTQEGASVLFYTRSAAALRELLRTIFMSTFLVSIYGPVKITYEKPVKATPLLRITGNEQVLRGTLPLYER